jgi:hypothetical protein
MDEAAKPRTLDNMIAGFVPIASEVVNVAIACGIGVLLFRTYRWIYAQSKVLGVVVGAGIILRAVIGLSLFWISFLNMPVLRTLHLGDGFWALMGDARGYYRYAVTAVEVGMYTVGPGFSSPLFTKTLAVWMHLVGISPAAGLMLNVSLYTALAALITWIFKPRNEWRADLPCIVGVGGFFLSPVLVVHGTQTLKEDLFNTLMGLLCISTLYVVRPLVYGKLRGRLVFAGWLVILVAATFYIAGIRAYYAAIVWAVMACVLVLFLFRQRIRRMPAYSVAAVLLLATMWAGYAYGSGPYYMGPSRNSLAEFHRMGPVDVFKTLVNLVDHARTGFWLTGGATNISVWAGHVRGTGSHSSGGADAGDDPESESYGPEMRFRSNSGRFLLIVVGLGIVFVPISLMKSLGVVDFSGGKGLLPFADLDTIFLDVTVIAVLVLLWNRRRLIHDRLPLVAFGLVLSMATAVLLGYVVTNFGTLFRMRSIVAVPVWILALALSDTTEPDSAASPRP